MKVCVISDLHCKFRHDVNEKSNTFLFSNSPRKPINQHPVVALLQLIEAQKLDAEYLICPGDLGDKADEQGIISSWNFLNEISAKLRAKLIGIPGNHDINSRGGNGKGPFDFIKSFHEEFPFADDELKVRFWEQGFCFAKHENRLFFLFNSVKGHTDEGKAKKSEITPEMLESIRATFEGKSYYKDTIFKVAVLHHHPLHHSDIQNWEDADMLNMGDKLLFLLAQLGFQVVIHGHKHQPRLVEINSLPVFAAGSFSSFANLQGTGINTMFHIMELNENSRKGKIYSWEFDLVKGWSQKLNEKFPPKVGFGSNKTPEEIAKNINKYFTENGRKKMLFDDILQKEDDIEFTIPEKLIQVKSILNASYRIGTSPELPIEPQKIFSL